MLCVALEPPDTAYSGSQTHRTLFFRGVIERTLIKSPKLWGLLGNPKRFPSYRDSYATVHFKSHYLGRCRLAQWIRRFASGLGYISLWLFFPSCSSAPGILNTLYILNLSFHGHRLCLFNSLFVLPVIWILTYILPTLTITIGLKNLRFTSFKS